EGAAASDLALDADAPAHLLDDVARQIKTETDARYLFQFRQRGGQRTVGGHGRGTATVELIKEDRNILRRDAAPIVSDADLYFIAYPARGQRDMAAVGSVL